MIFDVDKRPIEFSIGWGFVVINYLKFFSLPSFLFYKIGRQKSTQDNYKPWLVEKSTSFFLYGIKTSENAVMTFKIDRCIIFCWGLRDWRLTFWKYVSIGYKI